MTITHTYKEVAVIPEVRVPMILRDLGEIEKLGGIEAWVTNPVYILLMETMMDGTMRILTSNLLILFL